MKKSKQLKQLIKSSSDKKKKERAILDLVYSANSFKSIAENEEPDFKIQHNFKGLEFGVEVIEFYFSQSRARINNIPGYVSGIISKNGYKHKDDINALSVKEFTLIPGDGRKTQQKIKGIFQEQPKVDEYIEKITELIESKNKRFSSYIDGLSHINLIIYDCGHRLAGAPSDKFHYFFFKPKLENALLDSKFREVFFVTEVGPFPETKKVYIPLKMLFLVAEMYRFNHIVVTNYSKETKQITKKEPQFVAEYLKWRGAKDVMYKKETNGYEVAYGNSSIFIDKDNKISMRDHNDYELADDYAVSNDAKMQNFFDDKFKKCFDEDCRTQIFTTELHFPIKKA
jgi:hypothetical protein